MITSPHRNKAEVWGLGRFSIFLLLFFILVDCTYRYKYIKKYTLNKKYKAYPSEVMLSFRYVRFKQLDSGLNHVIYIVRKTTVIYSQIQKNKIEITIKNEDLTNNYQNKITRKWIILKESRGKRVGELLLLSSSLRIRLQLEENDGIMYRILKEPNLLSSPPTIFQQDEVWAQKSIGRKKEKGLKY